MRNFVLACTVIMLGVLQTEAGADIYSSSCCSPCNDFRGFYVGANIGVISHTSHRNDLDGFLTDNSG